MSAIITTDHVDKRISDRVCSKRKAHQRIVSRALEEGLTIEDIKGKSKLYDYIRHKVKPGYYPIIYNYHIYILSKSDNVFITVLDLPKKYIKIVDKIKCKKEGRKYYDSRRRKDNEDSPYDGWKI